MDNLGYAMDNLMQTGNGEQEDGESLDVSGKLSSRKFNGVRELQNFLKINKSKVDLSLSYSKIICLWLRSRSYF